MITEERIRRILGLRGDAVPVLSLYAQVPPGPQGPRELRSRVDSLISKVRPMTTDPSVDRNARLSLRADLERIEEHVAEERNWRPGTLALFSCSRQGVFEEFALPRAVRDRVVVDSTPWVRALVAVLDEYPRLCVVFLERGKATLWELYQDEMHELDTRRGHTRYARHVPAPNEERVRHKAQELSKRHFREVVETLDTIFRTDGFDLLAIGGHRPEIPHFLEQLPKHLGNRVAGTFTVDDHPSEAAHIRRRALQVLAAHAQQEQRRKVTEVVETVAQGGRAALGLPDCLWAGALAAIDTLLIEEGAVASGVVCDQCGWMAVEGTTCPQCGRQLREVPDILDELTQAAIDEGGCITHVTVPTELSKHLVGALLRFAVLPTSEAAPPDE